jgi:hypothetical protein
VHDGLLDAEHVDRYKLLVLPNVAALADGQCEQLRQYVRRGGSLLATFETSLYDERGKRRADFGLGDLFGVRFNGTVERDIKNSYMRIESDTRHPILRGLADAGRIINTVQRVDVIARPDAEFGATPLTRIPSYPDLPMEEVYPRVPRTDVPEVYLREVGRGRVIYFPGDIDRTFWEVLAVDHGTLLRNAIDWATNEPRPVEVTGAGVVDVAVWRQRESMTVHLVNLTNPMMMKGPQRESIPSGPQKVLIRLPQGKKPRGVKLLVGGQRPAVEEAAGGITLTVASVEELQVVAIDL